MGVIKKNDFYYHKIDKGTYFILHKSAGKIENGKRYLLYDIGGEIHYCFGTNVLRERLADYDVKADKPNSDEQLRLF